MDKDKRTEYQKKLDKFRRRKLSKIVKKSPENGHTLDVVDMFERNKERFQYGIDLNV